MSFEGKATISACKVNRIWTLVHHTASGLGIVLSCQKEVIGGSGAPFTTSDDGSYSSCLRLGAFENFIRAQIMSFFGQFWQWKRPFDATTAEGDLTSLHLWDNVRDNAPTWAMLQGPNEGNICPMPSWDSCCDFTEAAREARSQIERGTDFTWEQIISISTFNICLWDMRKKREQCWLSL